MAGAVAIERAGDVLTHRESAPTATALAPSTPSTTSLGRPLTGAHAHLAQGTGKALRYPPDISPIVAIPPNIDDEVWSDLHALVGPGVVVAFAGEVGQVPDEWELVFRGAGVQLTATEALWTDGPRHDDIVELGKADAPEMVDLVARTEPGPFEARTYLLGGYLGIRRGGALVAMAGERLRPPGWTEISAVCTDPDHRGQGLASALVRAVAGNIRGARRHPVPPYGTVERQCHPAL